MSEELIGRFKDKTGREWIIDLDVVTCRAIKKSHGVDLANYHDGNAHRVLWSDDEKLVNVLWDLVEAQAQREGIDAESFGKSLNGDALAAALDAIQAAVVGFTRPDRRELVRQIQAKASQITAKMIAKAAAEISSERTDARLDAALDKAVRKMGSEIDKALTSGS